MHNKDKLPIENDMRRNRAYDDIMKLFEKEGFFSRMRRTIYGLPQDHDSAEYKFAKLELQRLSCPLLAFLVPLCIIFLLLSLETDVKVKTKITPVEIVALQEVEFEPVEQDILEVPDITDIDTEFNGPEPEVKTIEIVRPSTNISHSPKPSPADFVADVTSPITFSGLMTFRSPGQRSSALGRFGGSAAGEATVMRALRWLKMKQNPDGSWGNSYQTAMTGLAILTYLAHGEIPSEECAEFGETVEGGIKWLTNNVKDNGMFNQLDGNYYSQLIGAYALSEAYAMTRIPAVKSAAEKSILCIINGQQANGGFDYKLNKNSSRNDLSYSGWATQAIKAAHLAGLNIKDSSGNDLLQRAYIKCRNGIRANAINGTAEKGFSYVSPGTAHVGLTGVGALCLQLLGEGDCREVKNAISYLDACTFSFAEWWNQPYSKGDNPSPIYYWYYITQAKFHTGGERWRKWNTMFQKELIAQQNVIPSAISGPNGDMCDVGYWQSPSDAESYRGGPHSALWKDIMDTCLCTLQLEVYYRYLPSFHTPAISDADIVDDDDDEITIVFD